MLTANTLSCERGERLLFSHLSLAVYPGQVLQVLGANGVGKSSLLKMLAGLIPPLAGTISWDGELITTERAAYLAATYYLGHLNGIKSELTSLENVYFASRLMNKPKTDILFALTKLGLADHADVLVAHLSAGQKRRVALAQLLLSPAKLWILDEPFTALDRQSIRLVEQLLEQHCLKGGMAIIATHQTINIPAAMLQTCELV